MPLPELSTAYLIAPSEASIAGTAGPPADALKLPMALSDALAGSGHGGYPELTGDAGRALAEMLRIMRSDRAGSRLDAAQLVLLEERPPECHIPLSAWKEARHQLASEVHARAQCGALLERLRATIRDVFIANSGLVSVIGGYCGLDGSIDEKQLTNVVFDGFASAVGAIDIPGMGVVAGGLRFGFKKLLQDDTPDAARRAQTLAEAEAAFKGLFEKLIHYVDEQEERLYADWDLVRGLAAQIERDETHVATAQERAALASQLTRQLKLALWQFMLRQRWCHVTNLKQEFHASFTQADADAFERTFPQHWVTFAPGVSNEGKQPATGVLVTDHWLGSGVDNLVPTVASADMARELFSPEKLTGC